MDNENTIQILNSPLLLKINDEREVEYNAHDYNRELEMNMNRLMDMYVKLENLKIDGSKSIWLSLMNDNKFMITRLAVIYTNILNHQQNYLTTGQMKYYNIWTELAKKIATLYYIGVDERNKFEVLAGKLQELLFLDREPESVANLLQKTSDISSEIDVSEWLYESNVYFDKSFIGRFEIIRELRILVKMMPIQERYLLLCLSGPPGTGKSEFAKAIMNEFNSTNYILNIPELSSKYVGVTENSLKKLFSTISDPKNENKRYVIFFDEVDNLFNDKIQSMQSIAITIQTALAGTYNLKNNIIIIFATNYKKSLPPAILDRIKKVIFIDVPDKTEQTNFCYTTSFIYDKYDDSPINNEAFNILQEENSNYVSRDLGYVIANLPKTCTYRNLINLFESALNKYISRRIYDPPQLIISFLCVPPSNLFPKYKFISLHHDNAALQLLQEDDFEHLENNIEELAFKKININISVVLNYADRIKNFAKIIFRPTYNDFTEASKQITFLNEHDHQRFLDDNTT